MRPHASGEDLPAEALREPSAKRTRRLLHHLDFNAWVASGADPALVAGQDVWAQYWSRDPGFAPPWATGLTDALAFTIAP